MNDIQKAAMKRLSKKLEESGFRLRTERYVGHMSDLWLYSVSYKNGVAECRMVTQATEELRKEMISRSGLVEKNDDINDVEALVDTIIEYDSKHGIVDEPFRQFMSLMIARYVVITETWRLAKDYDQKLGIHIIVVDTEIEGGFTELRPALVPGHSAILTEDEIRHVVSMAM